MKTILATAYAINPFKGSEDAMGWNYVNQIARNQKVIAITRENNQEHIERFMRENPSNTYQNITFAYFDLPYYQRFWKKGKRGSLLYFLLWQRGIIKFIKNSAFKFDISHNLNFHNDWTPSFLYRLNKPMVWGPIGHHPKMKKTFLKPYRLWYTVKENMTWVIKKYFWNYSISLKKCVKNAGHIWIMNSSVSEVLQLKNKEVSTSPSVATEDFCPNFTYKQPKQFKLLSVGRFVPLKGFDITLNAFAQFLTSLNEDEKKQCQLQLIGKGPEEVKLRILAEKLNITKYVKFISWLPRKDVMTLYKNASAFVFPSHEGAGMVIPEALSFGVPCICIDNVGPGKFIDESCGFKVNSESYRATTLEIAKSICRLKESKPLHKKLSIGARAHYLKHFTWNSRGDKLNSIYQNF